MTQHHRAFHRRWLRFRQQPPSTRIDLTLADWAQQRRDYTAARAAYQNVLTREPANADAILGLTEVDIAAGD
ncbi:tetratricopeptide repeat protein, partial [Escherichia sp. HC-CC]